MSYERLMIPLIALLAVAVVPVAQAQEQCPATAEELLMCPNFEELIELACAAAGVLAAKEDREARQAAKLAECLEALDPCAFGEEPELSSSEFPCGSCREDELEETRTFYYQFGEKVLQPKEYLSLYINNPCIDGVGKVTIGVENTLTGASRQGTKNMSSSTFVDLFVPEKGNRRKDPLFVRTRVRAVCPFGILAAQGFNPSLTVFQLRKVDPDRLNDELVDKPEPPLPPGVGQEADTVDQDGP